MAGALALVSLFACNKSDEVLVNKEQAPMSKTIKVDIDIDSDEEEARAIFGVRDDGSGATTGLLMPETDIVLRIAVRQGTGTPLYQNITFKKEAGRKYARYSGDIQVPVGGTGDYKIAAVHTKDVAGPTYGDDHPDPSWTYFRVFNDQLTLASDGKLNINVPYVTKWQPIQVKSDNTAQRLTLYFKPIGTVLRMRIHNQTAEAQTFYKMALGTTIMGITGGVIDLDEDYQGAPLFRPNNTSYKYWTFQSPITLAPDAYSDWFYIWVFQRHELQENPFTIVRLQNVEGDTYVNAYATNKSLIQSGSVKFTIPFTGVEHPIVSTAMTITENYGTRVSQPKISLEYTAEAPLTANGTSFSTGIDDVDFFTWDEAAARFAQPFTIGGKSYSMPTENEMVSIFPRAMELLGPGGIEYLIHSPSAQPYNVFERDIKIGDYTNNYYANYKRVNEVFYGERFISPSNYNRTAFRYSYVGGSHALVEAVYLGDSSDDINTIATEEFWTRNASKVVARKFLFSGQYSPTLGYIERGRVVQYWTTTRVDKTTANVANARDFLVQYTSNALRIPVLPFIR